MKKLMALLLAVAMLFCLASCGGDKDGKTNAKKDSLAVCLASEPDTIDPALNSSVDGATMVAQNFLSGATIKIIILGLCAFAISTIGGLLGGVVMYYASGKKINPLIGSAGVSAVPMAARVSQDVGRKYNKTNFLLMHAMGPNVAGVIGSAIAAGFLLSVFGG